MGSDSPAAARTVGLKTSQEATRANEQHKPAACSQHMDRSLPEWIPRNVSMRFGE